MVDVAEKRPSSRRAVAEATVTRDAATLKLIFDGAVPKGDVLAVARVAGIQGAKQCSQLIPLCHPIALSSVTVDFEQIAPERLRISLECKGVRPTGVEMEALTAASITALTIYDMCKAVDRGMSIDGVRLVHKSGGRRGTWQRDAAK